MRGDFAAGRTACGHGVRMRQRNGQMIELGELILAIGIGDQHPQDDRLHRDPRDQRNAIGLLEILDAVDRGITGHQDRGHRTQGGKADIGALALVPQHDQGGQSAIGDVEISGKQRLVHSGPVAEAAPGHFQVLEAGFFGLVLHQLQLIHQRHREMGDAVLTGKSKLADFGAGFADQQCRRSPGSRPKMSAARNERRMAKTRLCLE